MEVRALLAERLREKLPEAELALYERLDEAVELGPHADAEYAAGIREAGREAIDYAITALRTGERPGVGAPVAIAKQARRAARSRVPLDSVLRCCYAGDRLLFEWITGAAEDLPVAILREIVRTQGRVFDHLITEVAAEYEHELERVRQSPAQRQHDRIKALLRGDCSRVPSLAYDLEAWHVGMIVCGSGAEEGLGAAARRLDCRSLVVPATSEDCIWAWPGGRAAPGADDVDQALREELSDGDWVALGEAHRGLEGWRLTHIEAQAAFQVAIYRPDAIVRCRDVILVSAIMRDPQLVSSLIKIYLEPLDGRSNSGQVLRETLRVYFKAEQNAATAATLLEIDRHTVTRRLRNVESRLGAKVDACAPQLQVALAIEELISRSAANGSYMTELL